MCRKRFEPFKCEYVPKSAIVVFCIQNRQIVDAVFKQFNEYVNEWKQGKRSYGRPYCRTEQGRILKALLLLKFNYADSSLATGDIVYRVMMIYKDIKFNPT